MSEKIAIVSGRAEAREPWSEGIVHGLKYGDPIKGCRLTRIREGLETSLIFVK
jgi:hypothetical protein